MLGGQLRSKENKTAGTALILIPVRGQPCWGSAVHTPPGSQPCGSGALFFHQGRAVALHSAPWWQHQPLTAICPAYAFQRPEICRGSGPSSGSSGAPGRRGEGVRVGPRAGCVPTGRDLGQVISPPWTSRRPHPLSPEKERAWWALRPSSVLTSFNSEYPAHCLGTKVPILPEVPRAPRPHPWPFRVPAALTIIPTALVWPSAETLLKCRSPVSRPEMGPRFSWD